jgi:hypothetical protein
MVQSARRRPADNPGGDFSIAWPQEIIVSGLTSRSDMWLDDVDQILGAEKDFVFAMEDVGVGGSFHVIATLYVEGGGQFQPVPEAPP